MAQPLLSTSSNVFWDVMQDAGIVPVSGRTKIDPSKVHDKPTRLPAGRSIRVKTAPEHALKDDVYAAKSFRFDQRRFMSATAKGVDLDWSPQADRIQQMYRNARGQPVRTNPCSFVEELRLIDRDISAIDEAFAASLAFVKTLNVSKNRIAVLENLPDSVEVVMAYNNEIADVKLLHTRKALVHAGLGYNRISDVSFIQHMPSLRSLDVSYNTITDVSLFIDAIKAHGGVIHIYIEGNPVTLDRAALIRIAKELVMLHTIDGVTPAQFIQRLEDSASKPVSIEPTRIEFTGLDRRDVLASTSSLDPDDIPDKCWIGDLPFNPKYQRILRDRIAVAEAAATAAQTDNGDDQSAEQTSQDNKDTEDNVDGAGDAGSPEEPQQSQKLQGVSAELAVWWVESSGSAALGTADAETVADDAEEKAKGKKSKGKGKGKDSGKDKKSNDQPAEIELPEPTDVPQLVVSLKQLENIPALPQSTLLEAKEETSPASAKKGGKGKKGKDPKKKKGKGAADSDEPEIPDHIVITETQSTSVSDDGKADVTIKTTKKDTVTYRVVLRIGDEVIEPDAFPATKFDQFEFKQTLQVQPSEAWRDAMLLNGIDVMLFRDTATTIETTTTQTPIPEDKISEEENEAAATAAAAAASATSSKSKKKGSKKEVEVEPEEPDNSTTNIETDESSHEEVVGFIHLDTAPILPHIA
jgi:Leucine-rich repeat (LRR) protein